jgi:hypothetical protein
MLAIAVRVLQLSKVKFASKIANQMIIECVLKIVMNTVFILLDFKPCFFFKFGSFYFQPTICERK